jgi:hypothetical protein
MRSGDIAETIRADTPSVRRVTTRKGAWVDDAYDAGHYRHRCAVLFAAGSLQVGTDTR